jgi:hypothetical protein
MTRLLSVCAALAILSPWCQAGEPNETVIRLTVQPAAAPKPAMRYQLLPELKEMNPGNPILGYLKCFSEQQNFFFNKDSVDKREKWHDMPLKDLPLKEMHNFGYGKGNIGLAQADRAARLETPDWQTLLQLRKEGARLLIPEVQQMRLLTSALQIRFRVEIAEKRYDDALATAKTMFALARHMGEHPSLVGNLVGLAIGSITAESLGEMLGQPGCPNLFWALTDLPNPLIDLRKGIQGERQMMVVEFQFLDEQSPMTEEQLRKAIRSAQQLHDDMSRFPPKDMDKRTDVQKWLAARSKDETAVSAARKRLVKSGLPEDKIKLFPPAQVLLVDEKNLFEARRDEWMKAMNLPYWQTESVLEESAELKKAGDEDLFGHFLMGHKVRMSQARLEQRLGLLRCVEALRMYAAEHQGQLPGKLANIKLPLPVDPMTGQAFVYRLDGGTAILQGRPPHGMEKTTIYNTRFEIKIVD